MVEDAREMYEQVKRTRRRRFLTTWTTFIRYPVGSHLGVRLLSPNLGVGIEYRVHRSRRPKNSQKEMEILGIEPKTSSILGDLPANEAYYHCTISPHVMVNFVHEIHTYDDLCFRLCGHSSTTSPSHRAYRILSEQLDILQVVSPSHLDFLGSLDRLVQQ